MDVHELIAYLDAIDGTADDWGEWATRAATILDIELAQKSNVLPWLKNRVRWALYADASTYNKG